MLWHYALNGLCLVGIMIGAMASLLMFAGAIPGVPPANPREATKLKAILCGASIGGLAAAIAGAWLMKAGHPLYGALAGSAPAILLALLLAWVR
jgi:hypothetical protein